MAGGPARAMQHNIAAKAFAFRLETDVFMSDSLASVVPERLGNEGADICLEIAAPASVEIVISIFR